MGKFMAVGLTDLLESAGMNGVPAFVGLALLSAFLCMFIASGSAIWSILAPIFVPMFTPLGFHPAFAQILFRIADSSVLRAGAGVAVCAAVSRLPTALPTGCPPRHLLLAGAPLPADFSRRLAAVAGGMVSGGTADRPGYLSASSLTCWQARDGRIALTRHLRFHFAGRMIHTG